MTFVSRVSDFLPEDLCEYSETLLIGWLYLVLIGW